MPIILYNAQWMLINIFLALTAVVLAYIFLNVRNRYLKGISGILWLLFLPNTIYIITDMMHILHQWSLVSFGAKIILVFQYAILELVGCVSFILAYRPFEVILQWLRYKKQQKIWITIIFNFIIAFGMVLGRVERVNSWDLIVAFERIANAVISVATTLEFIGLTVLFGLFCNFFYFLFRDPIARSSDKLMDSLAK